VPPRAHPPTRKVATARREWRSAQQVLRQARPSARRHRTLRQQAGRRRGVGLAQTHHPFPSTGLMGSPLQPLERVGPVQRTAGTRTPAAMRPRPENTIARATATARVCGVNSQWRPHYVPDGRCGGHRACTTDEIALEASQRDFARCFRSHVAPIGDSLPLGSLKRTSRRFCLEGRVRCTYGDVGALAGRDSRWVTVGGVGEGRTAAVSVCADVEHLVRRVAGGTALAGGHTVRPLPALMGRGGGGGRCA
jgi:hypothetical protein